jgi:hypothetical protein
MQRLCLFLFVGCLIASSFASIRRGLTPFGYAPIQCIYKADEQSSIETLKDGSLKIRGREGEINIPPCPYNWLKDDVLKRFNNKTQSQAKLPNGWAAYVYYPTKSPVTVFNGVWPVPSPPVQTDSQTLFLFTGLQNEYKTGQPGASLTIIQPVLQYGLSEAGGGPNYYIASWFVGAGNAVYSPLKEVKTGSVIVGNMTGSGNTWSIVSYDTQSKQTSSINVNTGDNELYAFVTLEVYGVSSCNDYPNGSTTFSSLSLKTSGGQATPKWTPVTEDGCSEAVTVIDPNTVKIIF